MLLMPALCATALCLTAPGASAAPRPKVKPAARPKAPAAKKPADPRMRWSQVHGWVGRWTASFEHEATFEYPETETTQKVTLKGSWKGTARFMSRGLNHPPEETQWIIEGEELGTGGGKGNATGDLEYSQVTTGRSKEGDLTSTSVERGSGSEVLSWGGVAPMVQILPVKGEYFMECPGAPLEGTITETAPFVGTTTRKSSMTIPRFAAIGKLPARGLSLSGSDTVPLRLPFGTDPKGLEVKLKITWTIDPVGPDAPRRKGSATSKLKSETTAIQATRLAQAAGRDGK